MNKDLELFNKLAKELLENEKKQPVADYIPASELFDEIDLSLNDKPIDEDYFIEVLRKLVMKTPRTGTNAFFNQLFGGRNSKAILGDLLAVMLNNSMYTYKAAGPQVGVEKEIIRNVIQLVGWDNNAGGTFAAGGSMTNFMSMLMARDTVNENIKNDGLQQRLMVYTSQESHYSIPKNAAFSGIGRDNVRYISADEQGCMKPDELEKEIESDIAQGFMPCMVNATAGTTVLGAFDPIEKIGKLCRQKGIWLHVDGAYCGTVIFSDRYKHLVNGLDYVDSFSFNAHKMLGTPLMCSIIVVKEQAHLYDSFSNDASYLYQTDEDDFNLGKTSLQCGRRNDALKFWTLWKSVGTKGLEKIIDQQFYLAEEARKYIKSNDDYTFYSFDNSVSVCFNYKNIDPKHICTLMYEKSALMVGYGSFGEQEFIRLVTINAQNDAKDIHNFFDTLEKFVANNYDQLVEDSEIGQN